jgi:hypothetical protein
LQMPPGTRSFLDYLRIPWATWTDPQLLNPDLLRSVWGGTYATWWFDAHRHFLPLAQGSVRVAGSAILALALVPSLAFAIGIGRAVRRVGRSRDAADDAELPLLLLVLFTLAGYVHFTWQNPYYVCVKGSYLLGLALPFSYYSSEVLAEWTRDRGLRSRAVWTALAGLWLAVALTFSYGLVLDRLDRPGLPWRTAAARAGALETPLKLPVREPMQAPAKGSMQAFRGPR